MGFARVSFIASLVTSFVLFPATHFAIHAVMLLFFLVASLFPLYIITIIAIITAHRFFLGKRKRQELNMYKL